MREIPLIRETASGLTAHNALHYPNDPAFWFDDITYTWKETEEITDYIAADMLQKGIRKEMHIGFWSLNHIHLVFYLIAAMKIGAVPAVINYSYRTFELQNVIQKAHIKRLYLGEYKKGSDYKAMAEEVQKECTDLQEIRHMAEDLQEVLQKYNGDGKLPGKKAAELEKYKNAVHTDDVVSITFTSGTTKMPKPVMLTHYNVINDVRQFAARMHVNHEQGDVLLAPLPLFHSSGLTGMLFFALAEGIPAVIQRMFVAEEALKAIEKYHVTVLMAVPSMLEMLEGIYDSRHYDLSTLRVGQTSGAVISPECLCRIVKNLKMEQLILAYGQTECSPIVTMTSYEDELENVAGTAGKPLPHVEVRIWDLAKDCQLPPGKTGEIQVRGFNTMRGYYNSEEENKGKYTIDGWLKTTDAGFMDEQGYLHFVTRISDIIIRHGENISPVEIESVVEQYSADIIKVKVVGVEAKIVQEEIACLIQTTGGRIDPEDIKQYVRKRLASYKVPKYVFRVDTFPVTETGKIDQAATKKIAKELVRLETAGLSEEE